MSSSSSVRCVHCGLVNFASAEACKRCGGDPQRAGEASGEWAGVNSNELLDDETPGDGRRSILKRACVVAGATMFALVLFYVSLLETSEPVTFDQKQTIHRAIDVIERKGFTGDAFRLRRLANFRTTDNWWNRWVGHADAYAATNFPFEVVTLYPEFFQLPVDDIERAAILLHEAHHLGGSGEEKAFSEVWRDKNKLGWTKEKYGSTHVWKNVAEFTLNYAPTLFNCGLEHDADCTD